MSIFEGSGVALVTPFKENGEVDFDKMKELVEFHIAMVQMPLSYVEQQVKHLHYHMKNISHV